LNAYAIWLGSEPIIKKVNSKESSLSLHTSSLHAEWFAGTKIVGWIKYISQSCIINSGNRVLFYELIKSFPGSESEFNEFINSELWKEIRETALLLV